MAPTPDLWLLPDALYDGARLAGGLALGVAAGQSLALLPVDSLPASAPRLRLGGILTPGFVDLQVNGGGDALVNTAPTADSLRRMAAAHRRFGTVAILPTVLTDAPEVLAAAVEAALATRGETGLLGLHLEGPHLSQARRGTHAAEWIRPFEPATLHHIQRLRAAGLAVMITLAPESVIPAQVARIVKTGAIVSIGHSDASASDTHALLEAGASCFTHLFNAMSPMLARAPGVTGAAITSTAHVGIICDGIHVDDAMVGLAIRARPVPDRMFLVSDAMSTVGGSDSLMLYGQEIRLHDGRLINAQGALAGAHVTLAQSLTRLITRVGIAAEPALAMAIATPARLIGRPDLASPVNRRLADLLCLAPDGSVRAALSDLI